MVVHARPGSEAEQPEPHGADPESPVLPRTRLALIILAVTLGLCVVLLGSAAVLDARSTTGPGVLSGNLVTLVHAAFTSLAGLLAAALAGSELWRRPTAPDGTPAGFAWPAGTMGLGLLLAAFHATVFLWLVA